MFFIIIASLVFFRNLFYWIIAEDASLTKKRMKQLRFDEEAEEKNKDLLEKVTKPIIDHVFPYFKFSKDEEIAYKLTLANWGKWTPMEYRALNYLLKAAGIVFGLITWKIHPLFGIVFFVIGMFSLPILLKNSINTRKEKLLNDFPDFIRITEGYLSANYPFSKAVEEAIPYVGEEWKPILKEFIATVELKSIDAGLEQLKKDVPIFEVKEFISLVKLTLEQGDDIRESLGKHAEKIRELQLEVIAIKISKRQTMAILLQGPLLLTNIVTIGLPTFYAMQNIGSL